MLRYFIVSVVVAAVAYVAMRFTIGTAILTDLPAELAQDSYYVVPGLFAAFISCWLLRPVVRAHSFMGPMLATVLYPFFVGSAVTVYLFVAGRSQEESMDVVGSMDGTIQAVIDAPLYVLGSLPVAFPIAGLAVFALRKSEPGEAMTDKKEKAQAGPFKM